MLAATSSHFRQPTVEELEELLDVAPAEPIAARALCNDGNGTLVGLFFSEQLNDIARAKSICQRCPVQPDCLEGAIARREPWGVWGGELFMNGKVLAFKRKRGRPPKQPRPEEIAAATGVPLPSAGA